MANKKPMQADGRDGRRGAPDGVGQGRISGGESSGGPYPNPHRGKKKPKNSPSDFLGHGGQTEIGYHGPGQLGDQHLKGPRKDTAAMPDRKIKKDAD